MNSGKPAANIYGPGAVPGRIRFYNGCIFTMQVPSKIQLGELWTEGNRVLYAGAPKQSDLPFDAEFDLRGNLLMPGFKNGHAHSPMTFLRSYADDLPLDRWLNEKIFPMEAKLNGEDVYVLYKLAVLEYLSSGITAAFDMYPYVYDMARAARDCGFRGVFCGTVNDFVDSPALLEQQYLDLNAYHDRVTFRLGFHAEYTNHADSLHKIAALSQTYRAPVYFHCSETAKEVAACMERYGKTPTAYLHSIGMLEHGGGAYHCVHVTQEDLRILRECGVGVITNPASNCKLASGIAPVLRMLEEHVQVGIGTDGPASNNALDIFREMYLLCALQRIAAQDATVLPAAQILEMATRNTAGIMGLRDCASLAPGMLADLIVLDLHQPNMQPVQNLENNLVFAGGKQNVILTMVDGRILYQDGKFYTGEEAEDIYGQAGAILERMAT